MKLTRKGFRAHLGTMNPRAIAGYSQQGDGCPIARYLKDGSANNPCVGDEKYTRNSKFNEVGKSISRWSDTPPWAREFIRIVDRYGTNRRITASRALKILDGES